MHIPRSEYTVMAKRYVELKMLHTCRRKDIRHLKTTFNPPTHANPHHNRLSHPTSNIHPSRTVNIMQPNFLLLPRRIRTRPQNRPHLVHTRKQNRPGHKPPDAFPTRRTRQAPLIGPELTEPIHAIQRKRDIHRHIRHHLRFILLFFVSGATSWVGLLPGPVTKGTISGSCLK